MFRLGKQHERDRKMSETIQMCGRVRTPCCMQSTIMSHTGDSKGRKERLHTLKRKR